MAITGLRALQQYILREVLKDSPKGVMTTLPNKDLIEINVQVLAQRLMQGGIDPTKLKNANQVENAIKMINDRSNVQTGFTTKKSADVFDLEGKKIDPKKGIMGGKQIPDDDLPPPGSRGGKDDIAAPVQSSEETIKDMIEAENKKGIANIQKRILEEDREIENLYSSAGFGKDQKIDAEFLAEYLAENAGKVYDDLPTKERLNFYDRAFNALTRYKRTKGTSVIDEPKKLDSRTKEKMDDMKDIEDPEDMAQGGRAGYLLGGLGGLGRIIKAASETNPLQAYKRYLQSVKNRAQKGDMKSLAPELSAVTAGGIFINRRVQDILKNMKEKDMENNLENFKKELNADPFYQEYPELKDKTIEAYTERLFGEKRATGGRAGFKDGLTPSFEDYLKERGMIEKRENLERLMREYREDMRRKKVMEQKQMVAEGGRIGFKDGMTRRTFLKILGGAMSIPIIGKFLKPMKVGKTVTKVPMIKTDNVPGKPEWFDALVNKVIVEGDDVTKRFATGERQSIHQKTLDDGSVVRVTEDVDDGAVRVEYESDKNVFEDPVQLQYKKPLPDEGDPRPTAEFTTAESGPVGRRYGPDDYEIDVDEVGGTSIRDLDSDVSKLKEYATGKGPTMKEIVQNKKRRDKAKAITEDPEAQSDAVIRRQGEAQDYDYDDYASGGIARMLGE